MAEFASKGVAGSGLGLGIAGTALGLLNGGGLGGLFGGLGGGNASMLAGGTALGVLAEKDAEIARLKAENYSDKVAKEVYSQSLIDNNSLRTEMFAFIKPLSDEAAANQVNIARIEEQIKCMGKTSELREQIVLGKVNEVAMSANNGLTALSGAVACLQQTVSGLTKTIIPASSVCPQPMPAQNAWVAPNNCGCSCNNG
jgi:hypothetical protein